MGKFKVEGAQRPPRLFENHNFQSVGVVVFENHYFQSVGVVGERFSVMVLPSDARK